MPAAVDPDIADLGFLLEQRALDNDQVGGLSRFDRPDDVVEPQELGRHRRECGECRFVIEAVLHSPAQVRIEVTAFF